MFYYYATTHEYTINFEREATAEEFNLLEPHISKISKMLVDKWRISVVSAPHGNSCWSVLSRINVMLAPLK